MYKISDCSKISKLTVKALRYYDQEGILKPVRRSEENAYRYYDENDFQKACRIVRLRGLGFSIFEEKKNQILSNMEKERKQIEKIILHLAPGKAEENNMDYQVTTKESAAVTVAAIRFKGKYSDVGKHLATIYKAIRNNGDGPPVVKGLSTTHMWGYDTLNRAYKALPDAASAQNLTLKTPLKEIYLKGPGMIFRGNENNYITEIIMPIEEICHG